MKAIMRFVMPVIILATIFVTNNVKAVDFTLSDEGLMMLKDTNKHVVAKSSLVEKRDRPGPGVEFDIYFPGVKPGESNFECVLASGPNSPSFSFDPSMYDAFALKFTLLAVDGDSSPNHTGKLIVGSYLNAGYKPECVTLAPAEGDTNTAISRTRMATKIFSIGITAHLLTEDGWEPNGTTITLLIEPAPDAAAFPKSQELRPQKTANRILYVDASSTGADNGLSWSGAFRTLQDALAIASQGDQIWVARGTYTPNQGNKQPARGAKAATFTLRSGVEIYGGFPSGGGRWEDGNPLTYETILSGDIRTNDIKFNNPEELMSNSLRSDNTIHVVTVSGTDETAVLDGFVITGGNANGPGYQLTNQGGGIYGKAGSPTISNCTFKLNSAETGGAVYIWKGNPKFTNCRFTDNFANDGGGAMYNSESNPTIINCLFTRNKAVEKGGAIHNEAGRANIINCTITRNYAYAGGGVHNQKSTAILTNCIVWGNTSRYGADEPAQVYGINIKAGNCCIQGLTEELGGKNCFSKDPRISDLDTSGYHLLAGSPCIDAGDSKAIPDNIVTDIDTNPRISGSSIDIGAFEMQ